MVTGPEAEQELDAILQDYISPAGPGISLLVGRDKEVIVNKGYGLADVEGGVPMAGDSRTVIGSVTKQFTATAIMMLKHRGLLRYDEPIGRFFPDFPEYRNRVTVRHLLHHTSGVPEYLTEEFWKESADGRYPDLRSVFELIKTKGDLEFEPGARWRYCNSGYVMLGDIVEQLSGQSFAAFVQANILDPLGMTDSLVGEGAERVPRMAIGYEYKTKTEFSPAPWHFIVVGWADGNIISSARDLFTWGQYLHTDKLLPYAVGAEAFVPCRPLDPSFTRYGFGHTITERRGVREIHHGGGTLGYTTWFTRFPDERLTIAMLSNAAGVENTEIAGKIAELFLGDRMAPLVAVALPQSQLAEKVGHFRAVPRGKEVNLRIALELGELVVTIDSPPPQGKRSVLLPLSRNLYCENRYTDSYIRFVWEDGRVTGARALVGGGVSDFARVD
jgi:CubicO group peptidase (beta-lactamase class C family)